MASGAFQKSSAGFYRVLTPTEAQKKKLLQVTSLPIVAGALTRLQQELPKDLLYHTVQHTQQVLEQAVLLAILEHRSSRELELIAVAAAFHDMGYLKQHFENEPIGAAYARSALESTSAFSASETAVICQMILDTSLDWKTRPIRHKLQTPLSKYLVDGDMSNLGSSAFLPQGDLLQQEQKVARPLYLERSLRLLEDHVWATPTAERLWAEAKARNLEGIRKEIAAGESRGRSGS